MAAMTLDSIGIDGLLPNQITMQVVNSDNLYYNLSIYFYRAIVRKICSYNYKKGNKDFIDIVKARKFY